MKLGIVGLPNVGKSTLFNALTKAGADAQNYPFCTIEPNVGIVTVPDERLSFLSELYHPKKTTPAAVEFVDIAGLVRGAADGEGLGNKFLSHIRMTDAIIHVVRCFEDENVIHVEDSCDPARDIETINLELIISDMEMVERRIDRAKKAGKGDKKYLAEAELLERLYAHLDSGLPARSFDCDWELLRDLALITRKPVIYAANMDEDGLSSALDFENGDDSAGNDFYRTVKKIAAAEGSIVLPVCAKLEAEISELPGEERLEFLSELGLKESGLDRLIRASYELLGLISFLTCGEDECRAWTIVRGSKAPQAAGAIHSDFERGFIRAEIVPFEQLRDCGSMVICRERGLIRSEGKEYIMRDGDVTLFRFNV